MENKSPLMSLTPYEILSNSETKENPTTLSNDLEHENSRSVFRGSDISMGRINTSIVLNGRRNEISCQKNLADEFGKSPSNKDLCSVLHYNNPLHPEDVQYSSANGLSGSDVISVERKRKTEDMAIGKNAKIKRSSNLDLELLSDCEMSNFDPNLIHTTFFEEIKLLSQLVEKMNLHAIDRLVDIISQLQRSKTYQLLSDQIQNRSTDIRQKRAAETKLLLCKLVHEQAKLQLLHVKRERLLKKRQSLATRIQESEALKLKLNQLSQNSLDIQAYNRKPLANEDIQEFQGENDEVNLMKQTLEYMDTRISNLTKSFLSSLMMKGAPSPGETIAFVNDHLLKRARCQIMRRDLQLWVVEDLKSSKDQHIVLNYLDLVSQRFTVTNGIVRNMSVSNTLNEIIIKKKFKDMDALTAFGFVIDSGLVQKSAGATSLSQETQVTSYLLGNLVDVMQEIQAARIELKNLIYARFCRSLEGSLNLELHFFDPNSRKRATVTLNTSCLTRGIYPSEIIACQIDIPIVESQHSSSQKLSAEIAAALEDLVVGFYRILRVCRCISHLVSLQDKK
uniref:uncharacterized protein LOC122600600 n=1 Tax=Erigeron canadensis TaxID=72917 RepID=UPI001CB8CBB7|nr:uncharacterized protein LOC122600600 [Erigeron canadensis]